MVKSDETLLKPGKMGLQVDLSNNEAATEAIYTFRLQLSRPLEPSSYIRISFEPSLGIKIPEKLSTCENITGFTDNPSCLRVSAEEIIVACSTMT